MIAVEYKLDIDKGSVFEQVFIWKDENGTAIDLTGYTAKLQVRKTKNSTTNEVELTDEDGITITAEEGKMEVEISSEDTATLDYKKGYWVLEVTTDSKTYRLANGDVIVNDGEAL